ncbi:unnamed protein product [Phytophthora fragariaefolia]|uniref:Unnamed protein product n=1 Tax=Phytophthora fragariaefolia TaxID=1490495 RepID=A0A9W6TW63_9STRA|nr:unnamed protein product [Phytophthora fragariaefolia]
MDMHLAKLARKHIECKFVKINAEKAPFFVEKLVIRVLPTVVCFKDGVAFPERVIGFDGLTEDDEAANFGTRSAQHATSSDNFPTAAVRDALGLCMLWPRADCHSPYCALLQLARKMVEIGAIREKDDPDEADGPAAAPAAAQDGGAARAAGLLAHPEGAGGQAQLRRGHARVALDPRARQVGPRAICHGPAAKCLLFAGANLEVEGGELGADGSSSSLLVAKVSLRPAEPSTYLSDVEMQAVCAHYAALYNEHEPPLKVCYARSWLLKLKDRERGTLVCSVEEFLPGAYVKYSNNSGYVGRETSTTEERERNTPQAFSHFSFVASDFRLMIVDIQGVADSYTDPQIHSADGRGFGVGNLGTFGMEKFLESHRCNEVCRWLGLRSINEQYKPGGTAAPGYEMPFGGAIKKSTNRITEERNTFSTSVTVSEAFGDTATADWTEREDSRLDSGDEDDDDEEDEEDEEDPGEHSDSTSYATDSSPAMSGLHPRHPKSKRQKRFFSSAVSSRGRGGGRSFGKSKDRELSRRFRHPTHMSKGGGLVTGSPGAGNGGLWTCVVRNLFCGCG